MEFPTSSQPRSWAEALQVYERQKRSAPPPPHTPPSRHVPQSHPCYHSFNPLTVFSPSPAEDSRPIAVRPRLAPSAHYNILAPHPSSPPPSSLSSTSSSSLHWSERGERGYDLISCHPLYPDSRALFQRQDEAARARELRQGAVRQAREQREWDVVGNRWKGKRGEVEEKERREEAVRRSALTERYWRTHHYNPVAGEYYAPEKELAWRRAKAEEEAKWGAEREARRRHNAHHEATSTSILHHVGQDR